MSDSVSSQDLAIIGGGAGLIGSAVFKRFTEANFKAVSLDSQHTNSDENKVQIDLTDPTQVEHFFEKIFKSPQFSSLTLVNTQGLSDPHTGPLKDLSFQQWKRYFQTNMDSYFLTCRELLRYQDNFKKASIINLSSTRHFMAEKDTEAYCATKGAITSFTQALAMSQTDSKIRVNSISPGWIAPPDSDLRQIDHEQHPVGRVGNPRDIAEMCFYLASDSSSFLTGQDIVIDGGMTRKMIYQ